MVDTQVDVGEEGAGEFEELARLTTHVDAFQDPLIGWKVNERYLVEKVLADGGMGRIYLASDEAGGRVALKTLLPRFAADQEFVTRFLREVRTLRDARCPHVVSVIEHGFLDDGRVFFAMPYVPGVSLDHELQLLEGRGMPTRRVLRITLQLCAALVPAHEVGIVHRDLKPNNIMLSEVGGERDVVTVLDFGLAKPMDARRGITQTGRLIGTPIYMSPEQCRGQRIDDRSDIYALGVLMYELLCGEAPFESEEPYEVIEAHLNEAVVPPSRRRPRVDIPASLEWMLLCCLHKDPERRFQTMREVHEEMSHIAKALSVELPKTAR